MQPSGWCSTSRATVAEDADPLVAAVHRLLAHADSKRRLGGAHQRRHRRGRRPGPPVRRRGHRPVPHRAHVPRRPARAGRAADPGRHRRRARRPRWPRCCRCSAPTSSSIFRAMDGLPVTVRLIDPPLHEFLPPLEELAVKVAVAEASAARTRDATGCCWPRYAGCTSRTRCSACAAYASAWSSRACSRCRCGRSPRPRRTRAREGGDPSPEIMVPLVGAVQELETVRAEASRCVAEVAADERRRGAP